MKFIVTKIYKYTVEVEVEAEDSHEAEEIAMSEDGERNNNDWLYDMKVKETK